MCEEVRVEKRRKLLKELTTFCYLQEAYWNCSKTSKFLPLLPLRLPTLINLILLLVRYFYWRFQLVSPITSLGHCTFHVPWCLQWAFFMPREPILPATIQSTQSGHLIQGQTNNLCVVFLKRDCLASDIFTLVNMNWETNQWVEIEAKTSWK